MFGKKFASSVQSRYQYSYGYRRMKSAIRIKSGQLYESKSVFIRRIRVHPRDHYSYVGKIRVKSFPSVCHHSTKTQAQQKTKFRLA